MRNVKIVKEEDIVSQYDKSKMFSDGIGKISSGLMLQIY